MAETEIDLTASAYTARARAIEEVYLRLRGETGLLIRYSALLPG